MQGDSGRESEKEGPTPRDLTLESAAAMIDSLPEDVPRESQLRIVQEAFAVAGIDVSNLERHTQARAAKISSEIELVRNRQRELREQTEETVRSLEIEIRQLQEEIRRVQEAYDVGLAEEEEQLAPPLAALEEVRRVRSFFDFSELEDLPKTDGGENTTVLMRRVQAKGGYSKEAGFREARF